MDQSNSESGKKWLHSASLVKVKPVSFADTLDVESERMRGAKNIAKLSILRN